MIIPSIYIYQTAERSYFPYSFSDIIEVQVLSLRGMSGSNHCPLGFCFAPTHPWRVTEIWTASSLAFINPSSPRYPGVDCLISAMAPWQQGFRSAVVFSSRHRVHSLWTYQDKEAPKSIDTSSIDSESETCCKTAKNELLRTGDLFGPSWWHLVESPTLVQTCCLSAWDPRQIEIHHVTSHVWWLIK